MAINQRSDSGLIRRTTGIYFVPFEGEVTQPCGYCSSGTLNRIGGAKEVILNMALCYPCHGLIDPQGGKRLIRSRVVAKNPVSPIVFKLVDYN